MSTSGINYYSRFGLEYDPFVKNSKDIFVESFEAREVLKRLKYLQTTNRFGILTGEPGLGKTACVRNWANSMNRSLFKVVYTSLSTLTVKEFYSQEFAYTHPRMKEDVESLVVYAVHVIVMCELKELLCAY